MPQLDFTTYSSQIFWFVVCFSILYITLSKVILPRIAAILEERNNLIQGDLGVAKDLDEKIQQLNSKNDQLRKEANASYNKRIDEVVKDAALNRQKLIDEMKEKVDLATTKSRQEIKDFISKSEENNKKVISDLVAVIRKKLI